MLLVCGGADDPNIRRLLARCRDRRVEVEAVVVGANAHPTVVWDLEDDRLLVAGRPIRPTGAFIRHDVFTNLADSRPASAYRASAWYSTVAAWVRAHPRVRALNARTDGGLLKAHVLMAARRQGLAIPRTLVTNDLAFLSNGGEPETRVVKPVTGGEYCQPLGPVLARTDRKRDVAAAPAIVQERLAGPDVRIYRVGERFLAFAIHSAALDYREDDRCRVVYLPRPPSGIVEKLRRLAAEFDLDFLAADFKHCAITGAVKFLEINTAPMFAAFDLASDGRISDAIIAHLTRGRGRSRPGSGPSR